METVAKAPLVPKPTDRMMEALATLAALLDRTMSEVKVLDRDFETRIAAAVQKTEDALKAQNADSVDAARREVHKELTIRFQAELQTALENLRSAFKAERERMRTEFDADRNRLSKELQHAGDAAAQLQVEKSKLTAELQTALDSLRSEFQAEQERMRAEFDAERNRLNKELQHAGDAAAELQVERSKLTAELQRVKDDAAAEIERMRIAAEATAAASVPSKKSGTSATEELVRTQNKLSAVISIIEDPVTELSVVIRKNVEKLELEAYLKGLRYFMEDD